MITTPTVLVLGAGASKPYNYPVGQELVDKIVLDAGGSATPLHKDLTQCNIPAALIKTLRDELRVSGRQSIDAFLESRPDLIKVGRLAIASELLGFEEEDRIYATSDWYQYLFNRMCDSHQSESFGESKVSIVTFNYDRSIEYCLFTALRKSFRKSLGECIENFEKIRIIHVHGRIGHSLRESLEECDINIRGMPKYQIAGRVGPPDSREDIWRYGKSRTHDVVLRSANNIKIIHEANDDTEEFCDAREHLNQAETICFLGFGYHHLNLRRLLKGIDGLSGKNVWCCGFGMTDAEKKPVEKHFPLTDLRWGKRDHGCLNFLRESGALL
jgi:hypothetical protein